MFLKTLFLYLLDDCNYHIVRCTVLISVQPNPFLKKDSLFFCTKILLLNSVKDNVNFKNHMKREVSLNSVKSYASSYFGVVF